MFNQQQIRYNQKFNHGNIVIVRRRPTPSTASSTASMSSSSSSLSDDVSAFNLYLELERRRKIKEALCHAPLNLPSSRRRAGHDTNNDHDDNESVSAVCRHRQLKNGTQAFYDIVSPDPPGEKMYNSPVSKQYRTPHCLVDCFPSAESTSKTNRRNHKTKKSPNSYEDDTRIYYC